MAREGRLLGTSVEDTYATGARSAIAARPAASPWSGPRPSRSSVTISTPPASAGNDCPRADTTITGPVTDRATIPVTRRSSVEPCQSSAALGEPMREERPPASTIPAASSMGADGRALVFPGAASFPCTS